MSAPKTFTQRHAEGIRRLQVGAIAFFLVVLIASWLWNYERATHTASQAKTAAAQVHKLTIAYAAMNTELVTGLQAALVRSCETNGNARAEVQREQLHEEIAEAEHPDPNAFKALVEAGVPPAAIEEAEAKAIVKFERRLDRVKLVPCEKQYRLRPGR